MKRQGKDGTKENPGHLQKRQVLTQGCHAKSPNQGKNQKAGNKNEEEMEKFTKNEPIPCDELSTSRGNTNNAESKRNLQNLLGSYYSSDEESEGKSQQREEDVTQGGTAGQRGKHQGDNQSDGDAEDDENEDNSDNHSDGVTDDEGEVRQGKQQTEHSRGNHGKTPKEKDEEPPQPLRSNPEGEKTKMNYEEEEPTSQHQNDKKKRPTSPPTRNKYQKTSDNASENKSSHSDRKINSNIKNWQSSFHRGYNAGPSWGTNPTQENCQQPPWDRKSFFQNVNSAAGRQYPYDGCGQYAYNSGATTHPKGSLNNLSLTNFGFSTKKEINVDLKNIPVIDQRQILSDWKPTIPEEKKKSQKYNIKTKVYNAASNTFDKVIIHGNKQKRKHQINWLAKEAVEKEYEILQNTNYSKRRTTNDKYGW